MRRQNSEDLKVPEYLDAPWLTRAYIENYGWHPVPEEWLDLPGARSENTEFGEIPWASRREFRTGDIVVFGEFAEWADEKGQHHTDRFYVIREDDIENYKQTKSGLLPCGVVVHPPTLFV